MYVSIASYRDHFLQSTIDSAFCNADNPENLIVGCFISTLKDDLDINKFIISNDYSGRVKSEIIEAGNFFSVTKCRNEALKWLSPEHKYVLQVDSHTRFDVGWDSKLIECYEKIGSNKAVISCYLPGWSINDVGEEVYSKLDIADSYFDIGYSNNASRNAFFKSYELVPELVKKPKPEGKSVKSWGMCGHFIFSNTEYFLNNSQSEWIQFWGEELYVSLNTFTRGWDVYFPNIIPLNHLYPQDITSRMSIEYFGDTLGPNKIWKDFSELWFEGIKSSTDRVIEAILEKKTGDGYLGEDRSLDDLYNIIGYDIGNLIEGWRDEYRSR